MEFRRHVDWHDTTEVLGNNVAAVSVLGTAPELNPDLRCEKSVSKSPASGIKIIIKLIDNPRLLKRVLLSRCSVAVNWTIVILLLKGQRFFSSLPHPDRLWVLTNVLCNRYWKLLEEPTPLYVAMAWRLVKDRTAFIFTQVARY